MNIDKAFAGNFLKADDIEEDTTLTISKVAIETVGTDERPIVYFDGHEKGLVLNKTNKETIKGLYGKETDDWIGNKITLFTTEVDYQGKQVMAIRVRMKAPKTGTPAAPAKPADMTTAFWAYAYQHDINRTDATAYLTEAQNDFTRALALMQAQTEAA
jgi:hypothetical protein